MKITLCDHHAARPSPRAQMIVRLEWLFILLVALSLMVRPVPVALAEVPDGITTNDEHQPYQFDVNAARLGRRRVQGHTSERARWIELDVETATRILGDDWRRLIEMLEAPPTGDPLWQRVYWRASRPRPLRKGRRGRGHPGSTNRGSRAPVVVRRHRAHAVLDPRPRSLAARRGRGARAPDGVRSDAEPRSTLRSRGGDRSPCPSGARTRVPCLPGYARSRGGDRPPGVPGRISAEPQSHQHHPPEETPARTAR